MRILVTGGAGFVARHLSRKLSAAGHDVVLTDVVPASGVRIADLTDRDSLCRMVAEVKPAACVHLGAISFVPDGERQRDLLWKVNVGGTENLCAALKQYLPKGRLVFVSTAQVYGAPGRDDSRIVDEDSSCSPQSAYACSKLAAEKVVLQSGLDVCIARPANHTGPGQNVRFVVPAFLARALEVKAGGVGTIKVGNLDSVRDFTDVRDVVSAYRLILEKGTSGNVYNIGSDVRMTIRDLLALIQRIVGVSATTEGAPEFYRPTDFSLRLSCERLRQLGWRTSYSIEETLHDMLNSMGYFVV